MYDFSFQHLLQNGAGWVHSLGDPSGGRLVCVQGWRDSGRQEPSGARVSIPPTVPEGRGFVWSANPIEKLLLFFSFFEGGWHCTSTSLQFKRMCYCWKNRVAYCFCFILTCGSIANSYSFPTGNSCISGTCHISWLTKAAHKVPSEGQTLVLRLKMLWFSHTFVTWTLLTPEKNRRDCNPAPLVFTIRFTAQRCRLARDFKQPGGCPAITQLQHFLIGTALQQGAEMKLKKWTH